ncbi:MAG: hypothetical protein CENE_00024 [Candidatus Celerinatantimonas neptuna]|nr:MAG: hypothetical protein CENE_00024 [Candidatus Celerinatantimonas neptuna]
MNNLLDGLQIACLVILMGQWWLRLLWSDAEALSINWVKVEAGLLLCFIVLSTWGALLFGLKPWFEPWYAEQLIALMVGIGLMQICLKRYQKKFLRIIIGIGVCGWLAMAAKAGIHHQPIWFN